jgi:hypothetical protein
MDVLQIFEQYFDQEGLLAVIPPWRRKEMGRSFGPERILNNILVFGWVILSMLANALLLAKYGKPIWISALTPIIAFVAWSIVIAFVGAIRQLSGREFDAETVGAAAMFMLPLFYAVGALIMTGAPLYFVLSVGIQLLIFVVLIILFVAKPRLVWIFDVLKMARKVLPQAWTSWRFAAPILFVTVLLSFLSEDIWKTIGQLAWERLIAGATVIILPAMFFFVKESREALGLILVRAKENQSADTVLDVPYFRSQQQKDWISVEEWETIAYETGWKYLEKLGDDVKSFINNRLRWRFQVMTVFLFILLFSSMLAYFLVLSYLIFPAQVIREWTYLPAESSLWVQPSRCPFSYQLSC